MPGGNGISYKITGASAPGDEKTLDHNTFSFSLNYPMRILLIHNFYQQPGGEDGVFRNEKALLQSRGHQVLEFTRHNDEIKSYSPLQKLKLFADTNYNARLKQEFLRFVKQAGPNILHFHNTFPLISPAAYSVGRELNIPVVQTLHNYRFLCANALFYRNGQVCEDCLGKSFPWPGLLHACYRNSRLQTLPVSLMQALHRARKTWQIQIDALIALTEFGKQKMVQAGFSPEQVFVKPNFVDPDPGDSPQRGDYFIFVGRLSQEKGVRALLRAWKFPENIPLKIIGDGPLQAELQKFAAQHSSKSVELLGRLPRPEMLSLLRGAACLLLPSECYETFGLVAVEAFACGVPVIASRLGAMAEIVQEGRTGLLFTPGNAQNLAEKVQWASSHPEQIKEMGRNARKEYESRYTAEQNYRILLEIYQRAGEIKNSRR